MQFVILIFISSLIGTRAAPNSVSGADANPYAASAREFARRVAASFPEGALVQVEVSNRSTLGAGDAAAVRAMMLDELTARGLRVAAAADSAGEADSATITLSENAKGLLWVAEIRQVDHSSVMLMAVPRPSATPPEDRSEISLRSELLWLGPERVLAAAMVPARLRMASADTASVASASPPMSAPNLLLLVTDGVAASVVDAQRSIKISLPPTGIADRDAQGMLVWNGSTLTAIAYGETCTLSAPLAATEAQCHADDKLPSKSAPTAQIGSERAEIPAACGESSGETLGAGIGDYTQPDSVRVYEIRGAAAAPVSPALELPGPVMYLQATPSMQTDTSQTALAVVRNFATGDDEVYEISLVCGR